MCKQRTLLYNEEFKRSSTNKSFPMSLWCSSTWSLSRGAFSCTHGPLLPSLILRATEWKGWTMLKRRQRKWYDRVTLIQSCRHFPNTITSNMFELFEESYLLFASTEEICHQTSRHKTSSPVLNGQGPLGGPEAGRGKNNSFSAFLSFS